jgi:hypothetical protein
LSGAGRNRGGGEGEAKSRYFGLTTPLDDIVTNLGFLIDILFSAPAVIAVPAC